MVTNVEISFFIKEDKKSKGYINYGILISIMIPLFLFYKDNTSDGKDPYT